MGFAKYKLLTVRVAKNKKNKKKNKKKPLFIATPIQLVLNWYLKYEGEKMSSNSIIESDGKVILTGRGEEAKSDLLGDFPVEYVNDSNPDSVKLKAPPEFAKALDMQDVWLLLKYNDEFELQKKVKPTAEQNRLRLAFWREYERAIQVKEDMNPENIYKGIVSKENFYHVIKKNPKVVAWILKQPTNYVNMMEEALSFSMHRVREILEMPMYKMIVKEVPQPSGKTKVMQKRVPDTAVAKLILDTMKLLDVRVKGAIVQTVKQHIKSESTSQNYTANLNINAKSDEPKTLAEINAQIAKLESGNK